MSPFIAHSILILQPFSCLHAKEDIMSLHVCIIGIMYVIGHYQINSRLLVHPEKLLVYPLLLRNSMILHFQEKVSFPENFLIAQGCFFPFLIETSGKVFCNFSCKAGAQCNNSFMILLQKLQIHPWFVVKSINKSLGNNFHQILIALIILCQQNQMIIAAF